MHCYVVQHLPVRVPAKIRIHQPPRCLYSSQRKWPENKIATTKAQTNHRLAASVGWPTVLAHEHTSSTGSNTSHTTQVIPSSSIACGTKTTADCEKQASDADNFLQLGQLLVRKQFPFSTQVTTDWFRCFQLSNNLTIMSGNGIEEASKKIWWKNFLPSNPIIDEMNEQTFSSVETFSSQCHRLLCRKTLDDVTFFQCVFVVFLVKITTQEIPTVYSQSNDKSDSNIRSDKTINSNIGTSNPVSPQDIWEAIVKCFQQARDNPQHLPSILLPNMDEADLHFQYDQYGDENNRDYFKQLTKFSAHFYAAVKDQAETSASGERPLKRQRQGYFSSKREVSQNKYIVPVLYLLGFILQETQTKRPRGRNVLTWTSVEKQMYYYGADFRMTRTSPVHVTAALAALGLRNFMSVASKRQYKHLASHGLSATLLLDRYLSESK